LHALEGGLEVSGEGGLEVSLLCSISGRKRRTEMEQATSKPCFDTRDLGVRRLTDRVRQPRRPRRCKVVTVRKKAIKITDLQYVATIGIPPTGPARPGMAVARSGMLASDVRIALSEEVVQVVSPPSRAPVRHPYAYYATHACA
jgi:hypothetical protein